jgi:hypothetical protein
LGTGEQAVVSLNLYFYLFGGKKSRIYSNFEAISRNLPEYKNKALKNLMIFSDNKAFKNILAKLLGPPPWG